MQSCRPAFAPHPTRFGRGPARVMDQPAKPGALLAGDIKLFAATFIAGFVFVSIVIG